MSSLVYAIPRATAGARVVGGARRKQPERRPARVSALGDGRKGGDSVVTLPNGRRSERTPLTASRAVSCRAARGYESASTSTSTSKTPTDDAERVKPPPKKDYRRNRRPKAGAKPRYNRPPLHDPSSSTSTSTSGDDSKPGGEHREGGGRPKWLSHQHTRTPGQQPQQRRDGHHGGHAPKHKMNANNRHHGGMRPGERIVKAMEALPRASVAGIASQEGEDVTRALQSPETYGVTMAADVDAYHANTKTTKTQLCVATIPWTSNRRMNSSSSPPRTIGTISTQPWSQARGTGAWTRL